MLSGDVNGLDVLDSIRDRLRGLANPDLRPLAETLRGVLIEDNRRGLLAGTDGQGRPLAPLAASTSKRDGSHSPLLPQGENSPLIRDYVVKVEPAGDGLHVQAGWSPEPPGLRYQRTGTSHSPARDPVGLRPDGEARVREAVDDFASTLIGGGGSIFIGGE